MMTHSFWKGKNQAEFFIPSTLFMKAETDCRTSDKFQRYSILKKTPFPFEWGIIADIQAPMSKRSGDLEKNWNENNFLFQDVASYVPNYSNIRVLEGSYSHRCIASLQKHYYNWYGKEFWKISSDLKKNWSRLIRSAKIVSTSITSEIGPQGEVKYKACSSRQDPMYLSRKMTTLLLLKLEINLEEKTTPRFFTP